MLRIHDGINVGEGHRPWNFPHKWVHGEGILGGSCGGSVSQEENQKEK